MKKLFIVFVLFIFAVQVSAQEKMKVIFDTDMESDVDDTGALAMLHALADNGEVEILATLSSSLNPWSVPTIDVINTFYGRPDIPIGNKKTKGVYRNSKYARKISEAFEQDIGLAEQAPDAVDVYRKVLSQQEDNSVVIVSLGYLSNLKALLESGPDRYSQLTGKALVRQKVKTYYCMGGRYPLQQNPGKWGNFKPDPEATVFVAENWPTKIIFTGGGDFAWSMPTGPMILGLNDRNNPVYRAYEIFMEGRDQDFHHSADIIAVYLAVRGHDRFFQLKEKGYNHIFADGTHVWRWEPNDPRHKYISELREEADTDKISRIFGELMTQKPKNN